MEQIIVIATNKFGQLKGLDFHNLDEITDVYDYDEILECVLKYYHSLEISEVNYTIIKQFIEKFYTMIPKTIDEVLKYD